MLCFHGYFSVASPAYSSTYNKPVFRLPALEKIVLVARLNDCVSRTYHLSDCIIIITISVFHNLKFEIEAEVGKRWVYHVESLLYSGFCASRVTK